MQPDGSKVAVPVKKPLRKDQLVRLNKYDDLEEFAEDEVAAADEVVAAAPADDAGAARTTRARRRRRAARTTRARRRRSSSRMFVLAVAADHIVKGILRMCVYRDDILSFFLVSSHDRFVVV